MAKAFGIVGGKALTAELRKLAVENSEVIDGEGVFLTRAQALAQSLWRLALGWTEETTDDNGNKKVVFHPPVSWAMQYVKECIEGKAASAPVEETDRISAAAKVRQLSKDRLNKMAAVASGPPKLTKLPKAGE